MEQNVPFPVTPENFQLCWDFVDKKRRQAKVQSAAARIGGFLVTLFFLLTLIFFGCGLILERFDGSFCDFLNSLDVFRSLWDPCADLLIQSEADLIWDICRVLGCAYAAAWLVFALLDGLVHLIYHPRREAIPSGTYAQNTALLAKKAQEARDHAVRTHIAPSIIASVLSIVAMLLVFFAYVFYLKDAAFITKLLSVFPTKDVSTNSLLYILVLYWIIGNLTAVLIFLTRPVYRFRFSQEYVVQAQRAAIYAEELHENGSLEEAAAQCKLRAVSQREEALELERSGAYALAKDALLKAAICGDVPAMEHYARHCLIGKLNDSAAYWLKACCATEEASPAAKKMLLRLRLKRQHNVHYLKPEEAPPTTAAKVKQGLKKAVSIVWKTLILALFAAFLLVFFLLFSQSTNTDVLEKLPPAAKEALTQLQSMLSSQIPSEPAFTPEEVSPFGDFGFSLTAEGASWAENCIAQDDAGNPIVFHYCKDMGGPLHVPYYIEAGQKLRSAGLYAGNIWNVAYMTPHVSYLSETGTLVVAEDFLMGLEPGEYCIVLDEHCYFPLVIFQEHTVNSRQRGFAGSGNQVGWIVNDLDAVNEITLYFYNLGDNPIRELREIKPLANMMQQPESPMDPLLYTVSQDGCAVTLHTDYLAGQQAGSYVTFRVRLANGDTVDMGNVNVGTVQGSYTGLIEYTGNPSHSLSSGGDYVLSYTFPDGGAPMYLFVSDGSGENFLEDDLSDLMSEYVDLDSGTVTLPQALLKEHLSPGDSFHIGISYITAHGQMMWGGFPVTAAW